MELTDLDMKFFAEILSECRISAQEVLENTDSFFKEDQSKDCSYCTDFSFVTASSLYEMFDAVISNEIYPSSARGKLIRACVAACYKYESEEKLYGDSGTIDEFVYEF